MSNTIDKRVVELELDNSQFDRDLKKTESNLASFKEALAFNNVSRSIEEVSVKFSMLEVAAMTMVSNITTSVMNLGIRMVKSLSVDNISTGWSKFEQKTKSVATMMSQSIKIAGQEVADYSKKMDVINEQLEKLNWFTDQTSYSFTDMVDNIGKFTAAGQDLDASVEAMMGIANWAALSGQNATTASRAMYQLSQALSKGYVQLIDYKSIQNANMDTQEFRQTVLDTAVALGELTKQGENYISKAGSKFTKNQFTEGLSSKWFTSEVLTKSLSKYSAAVDKLYEISSETGLTAAQVMARYGDEIDEFGMKAFRAAQEARTFSDSMNAIRDAVSTGWMTTAERIFGAYTESKELWSDFADGLYDIFAASGDLRNQILKVWDTLGGRADLFKHDPDNPDSQGAFWNLFDSITALVTAVKTAYNSIFPTSLFGSSSDQVNDIANKFKNFTKTIQDVMVRFRNFIVTNQLFNNALKSVFASFKVLILFIKSAHYVIDPIITSVTNFVKNILNNLTNKLSNLSWLDRTMTKIVEKARELNIFVTDLLDNIISSNAFYNISNAVESFIYAFREMNILKTAGDIFKGFFESFASNGGNSSNFAIIISGTTTLLSKLLMIFKQLATTLVTSVGPAVANIFGKTFKVAGAVLGKLIEVLSVFFSTISEITGGSAGSVIDDLANFIDALNIDNIAVSSGEAFVKLLDNLKNTFISMMLILNAMLPVMNAVLKITANLMATISNLVVKILDDAGEKGGLKLVVIGLLATITIMASLILTILRTTKKATNILNSITYMFNAATESFRAGVFVMIAESLLLVATAFYILGRMDIKQILKGSLALTVVSGALAGLFLLFNEVSKVKNQSKRLNDTLTKVSKMAFSIIELSIALYIISKAMEKIANINPETFDQAIIGMLVSLASIAAIVSLSNKYKVSNTSNMTKILYMTVLMSASLRVLAATLSSISSIPFESIAFGVLKSASLIIALQLLSKFIGNSTNLNITIIKNLTMLIAIAFQLSLMASFYTALSRTLSSVNWKQLIESIGKLGLIIIALQTISKAGKVKVTNIYSMFSSMIMLSMALMSMTVALKGLAKMDLVSIAKSLGSIVVIAGLISALGKVKVQNGKIYKLSASIASLGTSLLFMIAPLNMLGNIPFMNLLKAFINMVAIMGLVAALSNATIANPVKIGAIAISLMMLGQSLLSLSNGLYVLSSVPLLAIFKGLVALASGMTILAIATKIMSPSIETILKVSFAALVLGGALVLLAYTISSLAELFNVSVNDMWGILETFITGAVDFVTNNSDKLIILISNVINAFLELIIQVLPKLGALIIELIKTVLKIIRDTSPDLCTTVGQVIVDVLTMLRNNIGTITTLVAEIIIDFVAALTEKIPRLVEVFGDFLTTFIVSSLDNLSKNFTPILNSLIDFVLSTIRQLGITIKKRSKEFADTFIDFGINLIEGLHIGIVEGLARLLEKIPTIGGTIADGFRNVFGIHSPSTVMAEMGKYLDQGLAKGIEDNIDETSKEASESMSKIISAVSDSLDEDLDDGLTITPVLDLSNVNAGARNINSIMSSINGTSASVTGSFAASASNAIARNNAAINTNQNGIVTNNNSNDNYYTTFNITTDDPEELARQTDVILQRNRTKASLAKGGV